MIVLLAFVCCVLPIDPGYSYNVTGKDKQQFAGSTTDQFEITTSFGHAVIQSDQVRSVRLKDGKHSFRFADGSTLTGELRTKHLRLETADGPQEILFADIVSISVSVPAIPVADSIVDGVAQNGVTYHIHVPEGYSGDKELPAILILHGSNMNSRAYVNTIKSAWPDIARRYILIGINGEKFNENSRPDNPAYNYSYVNFMGKSTYKGYPGTDRESPALVSEVIQEIQQTVKISKLFVGGHSQGGFLTYMLVMHYPELFAGAFPIAGGMVIQADPTAFDNAELRRLQRKIPIAIVHAPNDPVVAYSMSTNAFKSFMGDGFPMVRLIDDTQSGHMFANLPIDRTIKWLEAMTSHSPKELLENASKFWAADEFHNALGIALRLNDMQLDESQTEEFQQFQSVVKHHVLPEADRLLALITANADGNWVEDYHKFYSSFAFAAEAKPVVAAYQELSKQHQESGNKLYTEARKLFQQKKRDEAYAKCQEIVDSFYASSRYATVKTWLDNRKQDEK